MTVIWLVTLPSRHGTKFYVDDGYADVPLGLARF